MCYSILNCVHPYFSGVYTIRKYRVFGGFMGRFVDKICELKGCGNAFKTNLPNKRFCSIECRRIAKAIRLPTVVMRVPKAFRCPVCKHNIHIEEIKEQ